jgi:diguanylate cyclase (GGDEF)-like protein
MRRNPSLSPPLGWAPLSWSNSLLLRLYGVGMLALIAVGTLVGASIHFAAITGEGAQTLYQRGLVGVVHASKLELLLEKHRRIIETAPAEFGRERRQTERGLAGEIAREIEALLAVPSDQIGQRIAVELPALFAESRQVLAFVERGVRDDAYESVQRYAVAANALGGLVRLYQGRQLAVADAQAVALARNGRALIDWVLWAGCLALMLIGPLSLFTIRRIALRLRGLTHAMSRLARNDTRVPIEWAGDADEVGVMARAVDVFKHNAITLMEHKAELQELNHWFDIALNNMARGLSMFDANRRLVFCNGCYATMYALPPELVRPGTHLSEIRKFRATLGDASPAPTAGEAGKVATVFSDMDKLLASRKPGTYNRDLPDWRIVLISHEPLPSGGWVSIHEDVTRQRRADERIAELAHSDVLTGLANRVRFQNALDETFAQARDRGGFALLCLDLDHFKDVNDTLGHPMGDALLQAVARRLRAETRPADIVARLGGDEFAIIQANVETADQAASLAGRLITALCQPYAVQGNHLDIGVSIGIAMGWQDGASAEALMKNADLALYGAKAAGRGAYRLFESEMERRVNARRSLELELRAALAEDQLELYYQPIVRLQDQSVSGCEALVRWRHPVRGMISPAEFIPIAEQCGLIVPLGTWALQEAARTAATWPSHIRVSVNLSARQFMGSDLVAVVMAALAASRLPAHRLELEVTETLLLEDDPRILETLHRLRGLGISISLDDFGTGYSSLSYLRRFPFDKIKIDQTFVRDLSAREDCVAIVRAVAGLAQSLQMRTVAEGVETTDHLQRVRAAGCDEVQGYLFSRPVPARDLEPLFETCSRLVRAVA